MSRIVKPRRRGVGAKRLDLTDMRELFRDRRVWSAVGIVTKADGRDSHWEIVTDDGGAEVDIVIDVVVQPSQVPVTARLRGGGWWEVPAEGDEVALLVPDGQLDFMPIVLCKLSSNTVPSGQAPSPTNIVIAAPTGGKVYVHDGSGGAKALATVDHFHLDSTGSPTGTPITSAIPNVPNPNFPVPDSVNPFLDENLIPTTAPYHNGTADGTEVLEAK